MTDARWVVETVNEAQGFRTALTADGPVRKIASDQDLAIFENRTFGRVMILDGGYQVTTADEFIYHEMMAHVPLFARGSAQRVAIVGGGDGGIAREVLRHDVAEVTIVEIDAAVVEASRSHLPEIAAGAFGDRRLTVTIADGAAFIADRADVYDVIIVDSPDPIGAGRALFTRAFYADCARALRQDGLLVTQSGMPFLSPDWMRGHAADLREAFGSVRFFQSTVPSYTGGPMAHGFSSRRPWPQPSEAELTARQSALGMTTRYWSPAVHHAAFVLPPYIAALVG